MNKRLEHTRSLALTALLFALSIVLSLIEGSLPPIIPSLPGIRIGLSNIAVMYALFFLSRPRAFAIAALKSFFVMATRGVVAGLLSLSGGCLSLAIICLLMALTGKKASVLILSVGGAVFHNIGQLGAVSAIYGNMYMFFYLPVLIISGVAAGCLTAALLRLVMPAFGRIGRKK